MNLDYIKESRGLKFVEKGMKVQDTYGKRFGVIVGGNSSGNLDVRFDGYNRTENCHPTYEMTYYSSDGSIIAEYKD